MDREQRRAELDELRAQLKRERLTGRLERELARQKREEEESRRRAELDRRWEELARRQQELKWQRDQEEKAEAQRQQELAMRQQELDLRQKKLEDKGHEVHKLEGVGDSVSSEVAKLQKQIREAWRVIEQLVAGHEMAIADVKKSMVEGMEAKDEELRHIRKRLQTTGQQLQELEDKSDKLKRSREIIGQLKEEKRQLQEEMEERVQRAVQTLEGEKERMVSELSQGQAAALTLLQQERKKQIAEQVQAAVTQCQQEWKEKVEQLQRSHDESLFSKEQGLLQQLQVKEEEMVALEERERQRMAAVSEKDQLLGLVDQLKSEKMELEEDLQTKTAALQSELEQSRQQSQASLEELRTQHAAELASKEQQQGQTAQAQIEDLRQKYAEELQAMQSSHQVAQHTVVEERERFCTAEMNKRERRMREVQKSLEDGSQMVLEAQESGQRLLGQAGKREDTVRERDGREERLQEVQIEHAQSQAHIEGEENAMASTKDMVLEREEQIRKLSPLEQEVAGLRTRCQQLQTQLTEGRQALAEQEQYVETLQARLAVLQEDGSHAQSRLSLELEHAKVELQQDQNELETVAARHNEELPTQRDTLEEAHSQHQLRQTLRDQFGDTQRPVTLRVVETRCGGEGCCSVQTRREPGQRKRKKRREKGEKKWNRKRRKKRKWRQKVGPLGEATELDLMGLEEEDGT